MANDKGFTEQFVDYTDGRDNAPTLTVMVGISGSGKSVLAKTWVNAGRGNVVRFNRDQMRAMLYVDVPWSHHNEELTRKLQQESVKTALRMGRHVIVDDTNCVIRTRHGWEQLAREYRAKFRLVVMTTPLEVCIERDSKRVGKECVGEAIVRKQYKDLNSASLTPRAYSLEAVNRAIQDRQALRAGEFPLRLPDAPIWLVDMDGTTCNHEDENGKPLRSPYDMTQVLLDNEWKSVTDLLRAAYSTTNIFMLSGRDDVAGEDSEAWLQGHDVPFDRLIMRDQTGVPDTVIKQGMLDELLVLFPKSKITRVIDDRPRVVKGWMANGLPVYPVFKGKLIENFTTVHKDDCTFDHKNKKGYRRCPNVNCGAMEDF